MRARATAAAALCATLAAPAAAQAASLTATPVKTCYRAGERVALAGSGYTPRGNVQINSDGRVVGTATADAAGAFAGQLRLGVPSGERLKTYSGVDTSNTANSASLQLRVSRLKVTVTPEQGWPGRVLRVGARGFTTGRTLYAHVVRGSRQRNVRIGRLNGACRKLIAHKRLFTSDTRAGIYLVQFDTRRRYSPKTAVKYRFTVPVSVSPSSRAAAQSRTSGWRSPRWRVNASRTCRRSSALAMR